MGIAGNSTVLRWENIVQESYLELISTRRDPNVPDFYHPSGFWFEAKCGNIGWGGRIKKNQLRQIKDFEDPVVYGFGLHDFDEATKRLMQATEGWRQRCLIKNMGIVEAYFISSEIVNRILEKETKVPKKPSWGRDENGRMVFKRWPYCMVKRSTLQNIIFDKDFGRGRRRIKSSADYYGFDRKDYIIEMGGGIGYVREMKPLFNSLNFYLTRYRVFIT